MAKQDEKFLGSLKGKLDENADKIKETAIEVGFHNSSYFGRVFKAYTGTTPREYRASYGTSTY